MSQTMKHQKCTFWQLVQMIPLVIDFGEAEIMTCGQINGMK